MAHALLSKDYASNKAGTLLKNITDREVKTIERLGLGSEVKDEPTKAEAKGKGEKTAD